VEILTPTPARLRALLRWCAVALLFGMGGQGWAQSSLLERQVKAAYLYKFASFVEWPDASFVTPGAVLLIGVAGNDPLADQLEQVVAGRSVNGHTVSVKRLRRGDPVLAMHMLFIGSVDKAHAAELMEAARGLAVLTVTDSDVLSAQGIMIHFVMADDRLRFVVDLRPVNASRLRISARMLSVAQRVLPGAAL
jgi:hypothetical protein